MAKRTNEPMGFLDAMMGELGGPRRATLLEKFDAATPCEKLGAWGAAGAAATTTR